MEERTGKDRDGLSVCRLGIRLGIGIDVGGTKIWAVLGTDEAEILHERKVDTPKDREVFVHAIHHLIERLLAESKLTRNDIHGIGIGLAGKVDRDHRTIEWIPNLPDLDGLALSEIICDRWGHQPKLWNDGQLALVGEQWAGAARGKRDIVMVTLGTGVGGAIMIGGKLFEGASGTAGSMGWMVMDLADPGDPNNGWWERTVSGTAINRRSQRLPNPMNSHDLFALARQGDGQALRLVNRIGHELGAGIANLASILNPELVIVGGGMAEHLPAMLPAIKKAMEAYASPSTRQTPVVPAALLNKAGMFGALKLAFEE